MRYVVKPGDTLYIIAQRFGVTVADILAVNPQIRDPNLIFPGQVIIIPGKRPEIPPYYPGFPPMFPPGYWGWPPYIPGEYPVGWWPNVPPGYYPYMPSGGQWPQLPAEPGPGFGVLKRGSRGPEVKMLQERLAELGYYTGPIDGVFGRRTEMAVRAFQREKGFPETGIVEEVTWAALGL
ncbi:peptidoglycan-binding lysin domain-containing protein [Thermincola ferriacetica]|nr:peptidoglycan-binding protein [Thermincola ferriacetica]KNZ70726.1 peptidoglycan-binding lysin domain-containing protein [Thermincola ferriacetica]